MPLCRARPEKTKSDSTDATIPFIPSVLHIECVGFFWAISTVKENSPHV